MNNFLVESSEMMEELNNLVDDFSTLVYEFLVYGDTEHDYSFDRFLEEQSESSALDWLDFYYEHESTLLNLSPFDQVKLDNGASKLIFIFNNHDYVIKVPFNSYVFNYCAREVDNYKKACQEQLEYFFAPIFYLGISHNLPIYAMKKAVTGEKEIEQRFSAVSDKVLSLNNKQYEPSIYYNWCSLKMKALFEYEYSLSDYGRLGGFLQRNNINDIHYNNIGFIENKPVIIDYSGCFED